MSRSADAEAVLAFLASIKRRLQWHVVATGVAWGIAFAVVATFVGWPSPDRVSTNLVFAAVCGCLGGLIWTVLTSRRKQSTARVIEDRAPECQNLVITAEELLASPLGTPPIAQARAGEYLQTLVLRDAARTVGSLQVDTLVPARKLMATIVMAMIGIAVIGVHAASPTRPTILGSHSGATAIDAIEAVVTPPGYVGGKPRTFHNPARILALAGSTITLTVSATAEKVAVETLHGGHAMLRSPDGRFTADLVADADGFIAIEPTGVDGGLGPRRLMGLSVTNDNPPRVHITKPGRDIRMLDGNQTLDLVVQADDDISLASMRMRYTKVAGSGERFTFTEGEVPLAVSRTDAKNWKATAQWRLNGLGLEEGDVVVYRAVVTDHRPGAAPVESDSYLAEVIAPGGIAAGGFDIDTDLERYALSQQMIILKSERLLARRSAMVADSFADASADIGAEQRSVRAEFVFMMGGEIAAAPVDMNTLNEEAEAEGESDIAAGYGRNQGRDALLNAIRSMSRASGALIDADVTRALVHERAALSSLEKAFSHTRIILRALTQQERLDLSRRMTGPLLDAGRDGRPGAIATSGAEVLGLRHALAGVAALAGGETGTVKSSDAASLAEEVLRIDPSSAVLQQIAAQLTEAAKAMEQSQPGATRTLIDRSANALAAALRSRLLPSPGAPATFESNMLQGRLSDALRRGKS